MILSLLITGIQALINYFRIERKKAIDHGIETSIFIVISLAGALVLQRPYFLVLCIGTRFLLFDYLLNRLRGLRWDHHGIEDDEEDATLDKILSRINPYVVLVGRILLFLLSCWIYYKWTI